MVRLFRSANLWAVSSHHADLAAGDARRIRKGAGCNAVDTAVDDVVDRDVTSWSRAARSPKSVFLEASGDGVGVVVFINVDSDVVAGALLAIVAYERPPLQ